MNKHYCPNCYAEFESEPEFCNCGYPFRGTEMDKYNFMSVRMKKKHAISEGMETAWYARIILFGIGGINLIINMVLAYSKNSDPTGTMIALIYSGILVGLAFYSYKEPFFALLLGLLMLVLLYIAQAILTPYYILSGISTKLIFFGGFVYGLIKVKKAENLMNKKDQH